MLKTQELSLINSPAFLGRESIVIGCGGLGTSVVDYLKGYLSQYVDLDKFHGVKLLAFDTAQQDTGTKKSNLTSEEIVPIFSQDLQGIVNKLDTLPHIKDWFDTRPAMLRTILNELPDSRDGAATTRPFGRLSLFEQADTVLNRLTRLIEQPVDPHSKGRLGHDVNVSTDRKDFYIVASVGGGTGSGIFLDIAAMIRLIQIQRKQNWYITGLFVLPELLHRDSRVPRRFKPKIMANGYAALKELDHFLHGNKFEARYGREPQNKVELDNQAHGERLFNMVYLLDCPNIKNSALISDRDDMAEMISRVLYYLSATQAGTCYYNRYSDMRGNLVFADERPSGASERIRETRKTYYSTLGLATLEIPVEKMAYFCTLQLALDTHRALHELARNVELDRAKMEGHLHEMLRNANLDAEGINELFGPEQYLGRNATADQFMQGSNWRRSNRLQAIQSLDSHFRTLVTDESKADMKRQLQEAVQTALNRICGHGRIQGELADAVDKIVEQDGNAMADEVCEDLREEVEGILERKRKELRAAETERDNPEQDLHAQLEEHFGRYRNTPPLRNTVAGAINRLLRLMNIYRKRHMTPIFLNAQLDYLEGIKKEAIRREEDIHELIASEKRVREIFRVWQREIDFSSRPFHRLVFDATETRRFYHDYFLNRISKSEQPQALADMIKEAGLPLEDGTNLKLDDWGDHPPDKIAKAMLNRVRPVVELSSSDAPVYSPETEHGAKAIWRFDFKNPYFSDVSEKNDDLDRFRDSLIHYGEESLFYDQSDMINERMRMVFSGSRNRNERPWKNIINKSNIEQFPSMQRNQVTLINFRMGLSLYSLGFIEEWKRHYDIECMRGMPLHLFRGAHDDFKEPYFPVEFTRAKSEELFDWVIKYNVTKDKGGNNYSFVTNIPEADSIFQETVEEPVIYSRDDLIGKIFKNHDFKSAMRKELLSHLSKITDNDLKALLENKDQGVSSEKLVECAEQIGLLKTQGGGLTFPSPPWELKPYFIRLRTRRRQVTRSMFERALEKNDVLYMEVLDELVERIIMMESGIGRDDQASKTARQEFYRKYAEGYFPPFITEELTDYFQSVF